MRVHLVACQKGINGCIIDALCCSRSVEKTGRKEMHCACQKQWRRQEHAGMSRACQKGLKNQGCIAPVTKRVLKVTPVVELPAD